MNAAGLSTKFAALIKLCWPKSNRFCRREFGAATNNQVRNKDKAFEDLEKSMRQKALSPNINNHNL